MSPQTFTIRFNDAKLAYKRYAYKSELIPKEADLDNIKVYHLLSGEISIVNKHIAQAQSTQRMKSNTLCVANDKDRIAELASKLSTREQSGKFRIAYATPEERTWLYDLFKTNDIFIEDDEKESGIAWMT